MKQKYFVYWVLLALLTWVLAGCALPSIEPVAADVMQEQTSEVKIQEVGGDQGDGESGFVITKILDGIANPDHLDISFIWDLFFPDYVERAANGDDLLVTIPDFDFSMAFQGSEATVDEPLEDPTIAFKGHVGFTATDEIVVDMQFSAPIPLPFTFVAKHQIENDIFQFDLTSFKIGPFEMPESLRERVEKEGNDVLERAFTSWKPRAVLRGIRSEDGSATLVIRRFN